MKAALLMTAMAAALTLAQLGQPTQSQQARTVPRRLPIQPHISPAVNSAGAQMLLKDKQRELSEEGQAASQARANYTSYAQRVADYISELQMHVDQTHAARAGVVTRVAALKKSLPSLTGPAHSKAQSELRGLESWLSSESSMSLQAAKNVQLCQAWLDHERAAANNAEYNHSEAQQQLSDEHLKLAQAQQALERQQQQLRDHQYWDAQNYDPYYGGYGHYRRLPSLGGYGHSPAPTFVPSITGSGGIPAHPSGGSEGGSEGGSSSRGGGGHGGGHGGHR